MNESNINHFASALPQAYSNAHARERSTSALRGGAQVGAISNANGQDGGAAASGKSKGAIPTRKIFSDE